MSHPEARRFHFAGEFFLVGLWGSWGQITFQAPVGVLGFDNRRPVESPIRSDVQPLPNRYAGLYPAMGQRIDLSNDDAVSASAREILLALARSAGDPAHMPVTRDRPAPHRRLLQTWQVNGCPR
jgi:hypothetical protein